MRLEITRVLPCVCVALCRWWTKPSTQGLLEDAKKRVDSVKQLFDSLDADCSGSLDMAELISLASSLGAVLLDREWEDVLDAIKPMNRPRAVCASSICFRSATTAAKPHALSKLRGPYVW